MEIWLIFIVFCIFSTLSFFLPLGIFLLFLNKTKIGKKYAQFIIKQKLGLLKIDRTKTTDQTIKNITALIVRLYNLIYLFFLFSALLFLTGVAIFLFFQQPF